MGSFSIWHWLIVLIVIIGMIVPFWKIFKRTGIPPVLSIFSIVPFVPFVFLWIIALKRWPNDPHGMKSD
jgi:hypothetical protein